MISKPQMVAQMIRDAEASMPPPQNAAEAYQQLQDRAYLAEAVRDVLRGWGETMAEHPGVKPEFTEAMHEAAGELATVVDQIRELPPPPREDGEDGEGDEEEDLDDRPDWVQERPAVKPWHVREDHPLPPLPGVVRPPGRRGPPPDTHKVFVPSWYGEPGSKPLAAMSDRELRRRLKRARKNAVPRKEGAGEWWRKWAQIIDSKIP